MAVDVDPAILDALGLDKAGSKLISHGSSGFSSTYKLVATKEGKESTYFVKTGTGPEAEVMFHACEHASLNALHSAVPSLSLCPRSHAHGTLHSAPNKHFLITDFLDLHPAPPTATGTGLSLAAMSTMWDLTSKYGTREHT
ncbi:hypothetical protein BT67DRAFT_445775 [Trichocladium antarcticum]|uniref:Uncharacterized protein n=1 Tax=Trichocladium antarcticum TaxID=1450529 RepID=A0AAN6Z9P9_9PEZI|nr:hypothetical protein BT67DRAFT_445775 [Trichocladium antarcticum]